MRFMPRFSFAVFALVSLTSLATPLVARAASDDKCVAQCDEESDRCNAQAGKDASKARQCDSTYDECLRKCGN
jgi:hypothetical protein